MFPCCLCWKTIRFGAWNARIASILLNLVCSLSVLPVHKHGLEIETRERLPSHDAENENNTITKTKTLFDRTHAREELPIERNLATLP